MTWRVGSTRYVIRVTNPDGRCRGVRQATLDGRAVDHLAIPIADDGLVHAVDVVLGVAAAVGTRAGAATSTAAAGPQSSPEATARWEGEGGASGPRSSTPPAGPAGLLVEP
jgi:hypothetical protein